MRGGQAQNGGAARPRSRPDWVTRAGAATADLFAVFSHAARLLARHWPVVLTILLAGEAARYTALWAAVVVSDVNGTLGVLTLTLAPMAAVSALIGALYALRHSLPSVVRSRALTESGHHPTGVAPVIGTVLVPFLAIYASYGYLREDIFRFVNTAVADEFFDVDVLLGMDTIDVNRTTLATGWVALVVVAGALVARFGLDLLSHRRRIPGLVWLAGYLEALWLITLARTLSVHQDAAIMWIRDHPMSTTLVDAWQSLVALAGPLGDVVSGVTGRLFGLLSSADTVIVIPVAWLTVGAVVYGRHLHEPPRHVAGHRAAGARRATRMPALVRATGRRATSGLTDRFSEIGTGLRRLAQAGLAPMLLFTVAFLAAQRLEDVLNLAWRELLGPMPLGTLLAFSPHMSMVSHAIGTTVVVCLLGAAINRVLLHSTPPAGPGSTAPETPGDVGVPR
ncbi:hypothetical protein [Phytoactinopolyspora limicola]|uniref:hypothetical protein n=1 Tax=Phytoactinopolyspora limicola TaxID=2715536 RepID=UPI00140E6987|nr:hypothetical protein [Phytoactinopolyspora limicola]